MTAPPTHVAYGKIFRDTRCNTFWKYIYTHKHEVWQWMSETAFLFFFPHEERKSFIYADKLFFNVMNAVPYLSTKKNKVPVWHEILDR